MTVKFSISAELIDTAQALTYEDHLQPSPEPKKPQLTVHQGAGLTLFDCPNQPGNLRLTKTGCAAMFKRAKRANLEHELSLTYCRECDIGSKNSETKIIPRLPRICVRCERRGINLRLLSDTLCISCWNRQSEVIKGRNARGRMPIKFKPLNIYDYDDSLIIVARNTEEAGRIAERITGNFTPETLIDYGPATPSEIATWWSTEIKQWAARIRKPSTYNNSK